MTANITAMYSSVLSFSKPTTYWCKKPAGLNTDELEFELIDHGLEEMGEGTGENGEDVLVLRCAFNDFGSMQKALEEKVLLQGNKKAASGAAYRKR